MFKKAKNNSIGWLDTYFQEQIVDLSHTYKNKYNIYIY